MTSVWGAVIVLLSMFLFWRSVRRSYLFASDGRPEEETEADSARWGVSSFDVMLLSLVGALLVSRVAYIIVNPDVFREARWFYLPYEKIDGEVSLFSSLPWLIFRMWDFLPTVESLVLGWLLSLVWISRLMSIPWGYLANAVADVFWIVLVGMETYMGLKQGDSNPFYAVAFLCVIAFFRFMTNRERMRTGATVFHKTIAIIWKLSTITGLPLVLLLSGLSARNYSWGDISFALSALAVLAGVWIIARELIEYVSIIRYGAEAVLHPVPAADDVSIGEMTTKSEPSWKRYVRQNPERKIVYESASRKRDFSKSYKDYVTLWQRLWMKTAGKFVGAKKIADEYSRSSADDSRR